MLKDRARQGHKVLFCLDNAEDLIESSNDDLKRMLVNTLTELPNLQIIMTSRKPIGILESTDFQETYFLVDPMRIRDSVSLFLKLA